MKDRYGREWPSPARWYPYPWLDEGVAYVVASLREPEFLERRAVRLKAMATRVPPPTYIRLTSIEAFYEPANVSVSYLLSAAFVAELAGPRYAAPAKIRAILDAIGKSVWTSGDVEASVSAATGKDLHSEFAKAVARFW